MNRLKILQFPIANSKGGMTQYILNNWKWMNKEFFQCDFVTMSKYLDFEDEILATGSRVFHISCYAEENSGQFIKEFEDILKESYDVVHLHTKQWKSFLVEEACKKYHIPKVIVHSHNAGVDVNDCIQRNAQEQLHEKVKQEFNESMATDFWACSKLAADFLFGEHIARDKIKIMPNAIDLDKYRFNPEIRDKYRKEYKLENCFVIGNVGRLEYSKNHEFLIDVFYELSKQIDYARLIIIGEGERLALIQQKVERYGIDNKVLFLGKRNDVNHWYQVMDVFCLPSRFEGLGMALIEAQASGLPCIGSAFIPEDVKLSEDVFLLPLEREQWVETICACKREKRRENKECLANAGYDIKKQIKYIEKEYLKQI